MKKTSLVVISLLLVGGCKEMSRVESDSTAGLNGSFESVRNGVPVNWIVYAPTTVPNSDFDLVIDASEHKEGRQSLKFTVRSSSPVGGWHAPGLSREVPAAAGETYVVSFWAKNDSAEFAASVAAVSNSASESESIVRSSDPLTTWTRFERRYTIPAGYDRLRFEINVLRPGTFSIDDVTMERGSAIPPRTTPAPPAKKR